MIDVPENDRIRVKSGTHHLAEQVALAARELEEALAMGEGKDAQSRFADTIVTHFTAAQRALEKASRILDEMLAVPGRREMSREAVAARIANTNEFARRLAAMPIHDPRPWREIADDVNDLWSSSTVLLCSQSHLMSLRRRRSSGIMAHVPQEPKPAAPHIRSHLNEGRGAVRASYFVWSPWAGFFRELP